MSKDNKLPTKKLILPRAGTSFVWLNKPNTKFKPEGVYECTCRFDPDDDAVQEVITTLTKLRDEYTKEKRAELAEGDGKAKKKAKELTTVDIGRPDVDDDGEETGLLLLKGKTTASGTKKDGSTWTRKPAIFDAKGKKLTNPPSIFGGSEVKMAVTAAPYYTPKDNEVGITLYLDAVQVLKLVSGNGDGEAKDYGFGEEEGFEAEEAETFPESSDNGTADGDEEF